MSLQFEKLEKGMAKLTIEVSAEEFSKALVGAYKKNVGRINVPGFRKGKAPMAMIEKLYGENVFYEDAANILIPESYEKEITENKIEVTARPHIDIVQIEKGKSFIFTAEVAVKPEVELGKYKGIEVEKASIEVTDDEVMEVLKGEQEKNSSMETVEDRPAELDDTLTIDFEGFVGGEPFEGGKGKDYKLALGSHSFIDTFEDQLVGTNVGDTKDVHVTFPEEYHAEELKGKEALFIVKVNKIEKKVLPEIDDELAQDVSEFDTLEEYKEDIKKNLIEDKEKKANAAKEDAVIEKIIEGSKMEIADDMIDAEAEREVEDFARNIQMQGMNFEQYMQYTGSTPQMLKDQMKPRATKRLQARCVLEAVVKAEGIEVSEEEFDAKCEELAKMYDMEADKFKGLMTDEGKEGFLMDMKVEKAISFVTEAAVEK